MAAARRECVELVKEDDARRTAARTLEQVAHRRLGGADVPDEGGNREVIRGHQRHRRIGGAKPDEGGNQEVIRGHQRHRRIGGAKPDEGLHHASSGNQVAIKRLSRGYQLTCRAARGSYQGVIRGSSRCHQEAIKLNVLVEQLGDHIKVSSRVHQGVIEMSSNSMYLLSSSGPLTVKNGNFASAASAAASSVFPQPEGP